MSIKELPEDSILKALEGTEDVLTSAYAEVRERARAIKCTTCGARAILQVDPDNPFEEGEILPTFLAVCPLCGLRITRA